MNSDPSQVTFSRREFSALMMTFFSIMGLAGTARAGIDKDGKPAKGRPRPGVMADPDEVKGITLEINFPAEEGWRFTYPRQRDEWVQIALDPDEICPRMHRQLVAAKAAKRGTKILGRVNGDASTIFRGVKFFAPGEETGGEWSNYDEQTIPLWRMYGEGRHFRTLPPDNTSWWQTRLQGTDDHGLYERSFHEVWLKQNDQHYSSYGCGLAQDLMLSTHNHEKPEQLEPWLSNRERKILATFVQWLGTNCGLSFLFEVTRKAGKPQYLAR